MKKIKLIVISFFGLVNLCFAAEESITITTYYPSPYGSYNSLQTDKFSVGDINGDTYFTSADLPTESGSLWMAGSLLIRGTTGLTPASGSGTRLMWVPSKGAFRAGSVNGTQWNSDNIGYYSFSVGYCTTASGSDSVAMGTGTIASGYGAVALGGETTSSGMYSLASGYHAVASGNGSLAIGWLSAASGYNSFAGGGGQSINSTFITPIASGDYSFAFGSGAVASGKYAFATGFHTTASAEGAVAMGTNIAVSGKGSFGIGLTKGITGASNTITKNHVMAIMNGKVGIGTVDPADTLTVDGSFSVTGSKSFNIPHPDPVKERGGWHLRHSTVESPSRGDNLYRWEVEVKEKEGVIVLPEYFKYLNENIQIWVSPNGHFGRAYAEADTGLNAITVKADADGLYNILAIGTRKDKTAKESFDHLGVEYK
jgi:hypothetical protein